MALVFVDESNLRSISPDSGPCAYPGCGCVDSVKQVQVPGVIARRNRLGNTEVAVELCKKHRGRYCVHCGQLEPATQSHKGMGSE